MTEDSWFQVLTPEHRQRLMFLRQVFLHSADMFMQHVNIGTLTRQELEWITR